MDSTATSAEYEEQQLRVNERRWSRAKLVSHYASRVLRVPEVLMLVRHRDALSGRVLELGCGAGRVSGYLIDIAREYHGIDISQRMVDHCRDVYPEGMFETGDLRDLSSFGDGAFDAVVAPFNVIDVLGDDDRARVLRELHRIVADEGVLIMSSHNVAYTPYIPKPTQLRWSHPRRALRELPRVPRRVRNYRRLRKLERTEPGYAIVVDEAHDYTMLHYYIGRDAQERQLSRAGFELLECLDLDGQRVEHGERAGHHPELHYAARRLRAPIP